MSIQKKSGFTLIEVLISLILLSAITRHLLGMFHGQLGGQALAAVLE